MNEDFEIPKYTNWSAQTQVDLKIFHLLLSKLTSRGIVR